MSPGDVSDATFGWLFVWDARVLDVQLYVRLGVRAYISLEVRKSREKYIQKGNLVHTIKRKSCGDASEFKTMSNPQTLTPRLLVWLREQLPRITNDLYQQTLMFEELKGSGNWVEIRDLAEQIHHTQQLQTDLTDYLSGCSQQEPSDLTPENSHVPADEMRPFVLQVLSKHGRQTHGQVEARVFQLMQEFLIGADLQMVTEDPPVRRWQIHFKRAVKALRDAGLVSGRGHQALDLTAAGWTLVELSEAPPRPPIRRKLPAQAVRKHRPAAHYSQVILQILREAEGPLTTRQIVEKVQEQFQSHFKKEDLELLLSQKCRWHDRVAKCIGGLKKSGLVQKSVENGGWFFVDN